MVFKPEIILMKCWLKYYNDRQSQINLASSFLRLWFGLCWTLCAFIDYNLLTSPTNLSSVLTAVVTCTLLPRWQRYFSFLMSTKWCSGNDAGIGLHELASASAPTGWAKKVIPRVQCNVMHERYHFFGPPCT